MHPKSKGKITGREAVNLKQFNSVLRQVFLLPVVALLVVAGALYLQIRSANATVNLIQDSDARISQATLVSKLIVDEESGLRGYETTGDGQFLQPFTEAESHVQEEIQNLDGMAGADTDMKHDLSRSARPAPDLARRLRSSRHCARFAEAARPTMSTSICTARC